MDKHFLDLFGLSKYFQKMKEYVQTEVSKRVPSTRTINGKALSSDITLTAANVSAVPTSRTINGKALSSNITLTAANVSALPITGGTLTGNLTIKGSSNYGTKINFGDGDYVHISEPTDNCLEIKAKKVNFVLSDTTDTKFTINGANPFGAASGGSGSIERITWAGAGNTKLTLNYETSGIPVAIQIIGTPKTGIEFIISEFVLGSATSFSMLAVTMGSDYVDISGTDVSVTVGNNQISCSGSRAFNQSGYNYCATLTF